MTSDGSTSPAATSTVDLPPMAPAIWGTPEESRPLNEDIRALLEQILGVTPTEEGNDTERSSHPSPCRLADADLDALSTLLGSGNVSVEPEQRLRRARGKSTPDLLAWRRQDTVPCPDAVVAPSSDDEVSALLQWCGENDVAVIPFGGGTSVVGGLDPEAGAHRAVLSLDLGHFDQLELIDPLSGEATLGAGMTGPEAEAALAAHGFSLGHFPQSFPYASIGGFAMTRSSGQSSSGYGRFDEMVTGLTVVTPVGVLEPGRAPASAAGPDLRELLMGSEGALGVCTRVRVRIHPVPEVVRHEAFSFPDFATGAAALRAVEQQGTGPTVIRLSDETETAVNLATTDHIGADRTVEGCLCLTIFEGTEEHVSSRHAETRALLIAHGGTSLGAEPAQSWEHGRFGAPVLRDSLLDVGTLCETLETATEWSRLVELRDTVVSTLTSSLEAPDRPVVVLCHISHVYPTGASLYFTIVAAQDPDDPIGRWRQAKAATSRAIVDAGATITHHHAVGRDHREYFETEVGPVALVVLRAVKDALDPRGICNPGVLVR